jgi:hypothetical protein
MSTVPSGTRFIGISENVNLTERKSAVLNTETQPYTIQDLVDTIGTGAEGPQGVEGPAGPPGPVGPAGLEWQGEWVSGTSYVEDDAVGYDGASWFCILATSGTTAPDVDTTHWALLASQGAVGPQGVQGPTGPQGPAGTATQTYNETVILLSYDGTNFTYNNVINQLGVTITFSTFGGIIVGTLSSSVLTENKTIIWASSFLEFGGYLTQGVRNSGTSFLLALTNTDGSNTSIPTSFTDIPVRIQVYN